MLHGLAQCLVQIELVQAGNLAQRGVRDRPVGDRDQPQQPLGIGTEPLQPGEQNLRQPGRQLRALGAGGQQFLGEERIALGSLDHLGDDRRRQRSLGQGLDERLRIGRAERWQLDPLDALCPDQLGQRRPQRMAAVEVLFAVAGQDQQLLRPQPGDQEGQQVPSRAVGPVQVLQDETRPDRSRRCR